MKRPLFLLTLIVSLVSLSAYSTDADGTAALPPDLVKFAGLLPEQAAKEMTLPPGFNATLFAGEPDVKQPIAFAIDDRGRLWVAKGFTYPARVGDPPEMRSKTPEPTAEQLKDIFGGKDNIRMSPERPERARPEQRENLQNQLRRDEVAWDQPTKQIVRRVGQVCD